MKAELIDYMGNDLTVVNAARVSFDKESSMILAACDCHAYYEDECLCGAWSALNDELPDKDKKLISYLAKHNHFTPFTHPQITLRETVPIFVARQRFKHVVGFTYNEVSRRYVDDAPGFYFPEVWRSKPEGSVKQGSGDGTVKEIISHGHYECIHDSYIRHIKQCSDLYHNMLESGVAPEQARLVLPQSMCTSYYVTGSLAAFARAYKLRKDPHAQREIQDLADEWDRIIRPLYPVSWEALTEI